MADTHGVKEVIFDMSFTLGAQWGTNPEVYREMVMDKLQGSRGLYDWVHEQASAFEAMWVSLDEEDGRREDYYGEVDSYFQTALDKLFLEAINRV